MDKKLTYKQRFKQWITLDRATDLTVDIFLIIFDVLTHPILLSLIHISEPTRRS